MRIRPYELDIPEEGPFENDLLNRKGQAEILTSFIATIDGSCVLAIDAEWGMGKTTFLRMWSQHIYNTGFPTIKFNAWETDFSDDPLLAISTELVIGLKRYIQEGKLQHLIRLSQNVLRQTVPTGMRIITNAVSSGVLNIEPPNLRRELTSYERAKNSITQLKDHLQEVANDVSETTGHPLIIIIDELDRCRPSYAIELLEVTKHLFSIDNIVFVLAINRSEIEHSIKVLYGDHFNSQKYLRRFIDIDFKLLEPSNIKFIDALISKIGLGTYFNQAMNRETKEELDFSISLLKNFLSASDISLRTIQQAVFRFGLIYNALMYDKRSFTFGATVALILRTLNPNGYQQFISGNITEDDVYDSIIMPLFDRSDREFFKLRRDRRSHQGTFFKAAITLACMTRESDGSYAPAMKENSPLWQRYQKLASAKSEELSGDSTFMSEAEIAQGVLSEIDRQIDRNHRVVDFGFWHSVKRLELISSDLVRDFES